MTSMMSVFYLLSLFTLLGSQARILPGEHGAFKVSGANYYKDKNSLKFIADQIISIVSNYGKTATPSPPIPYAAPPITWITVTPKSPPPPPSAAPTTGDTTVTAKASRPPPSAAPTTGDTTVTAKASRPPPSAAPSKGWITADPKSSPPTPRAAPSTGWNIVSSTTNKGRLSSKSPPPRNNCTYR